MAQLGHYSTSIRRSKPARASIQKAVLDLMSPRHGATVGQLSIRCQPRVGPFSCCTGHHYRDFGGTILALPTLLRQLGPIGWLITLWLGYMLVAASPTGNSRYLAPILPMLCLTAG